MKLQRKNRRALAFGALAVSGALALTACGSDDTSTGSGSGGASTAAAGNIKCDDAKGQLLADGSSAQKNAIDAWVKQFTQACGVQINYKGGGSGAGVTAFNNGQVAFAGSDSALKPEEVTASKKVCSGGQGIDLPMVGGPIALGINVSGVDKLTLFGISYGTELAIAWPGLDFEHLEEVWWPPVEEPDHGIEARAAVFRAEMAALPDWQDTLVVSHWGFILAMTGQRVMNGEWLRCDPAQQPGPIVWRQPHPTVAKP